ncbi:uncharacterized protein BDV17DRAFT_294414 [Aspergillus undulatus]|uniref:uncharacterized protein n=1 Tax=Aspergillus undulatus TaxID=1810928 RepID=UPI003CCD0EAA
MTSFQGCMRCFRLSLNYFDASFELQLVTNCYFDTPEATQCRDCLQTNSHCQMVATGMLGDARDLWRLMQWVNALAAQVGGDWNSNLRVAALRAMKDLCIAFGAAELAHRQLHRINYPNISHPRHHDLLMNPTLPPRTQSDFRFLSRTAGLRISAHP